MRTYKPIREKIVVKIKKVEEVSAGGIVLIKDHAAKESMAREEGTILSMGRSVFMDSDPDDRDEVKVGDIVAFARYGGKSLGNDENGDEIRVMRDTDILVIIEEAN